MSILFLMLVLWPLTSDLCHLLKKGACDDKPQTAYCGKLENV